MPETRWWHRWQGVCPDGILVALIPGDSPNGPDEIDTTQAVTLTTIGCSAQDCETVLGYAGSWDHDPTDAEVDAVVPPGYRSTRPPVVVGSLHQVLEEDWVPPRSDCRSRLDGGRCFYDLAPCGGACEFPRRGPQPTNDDDDHG